MLVLVVDDDLHNGPGRLLVVRQQAAVSPGARQAGQTEQRPPRGRQGLWLCAVIGVPLKLQAAAGCVSISLHARVHH